LGSFIPLHTPQIGGNEKLKEWMVLDGMSSIEFYSTPYSFFANSNNGI
jgi:hypothetical protein